MPEPVRECEENKLWFGDMLMQGTCCLMFFRFCARDIDEEARKKLSISSGAILNSKLCKAIYGNIISTRYCTIPFNSGAGKK